jgi:hypothetical protein
MGWSVNAELSSRWAMASVHPDSSASRGVSLLPCHVSTFSSSLGFSLARSPGAYRGRGRSLSWWFQLESTQPTALRCSRTVAKMGVHCVCTWNVLICVMTAGAPRPSTSPHGGSTGQVDARTAAVPPATSRRACLRGIVHACTSGAAPHWRWRGQAEDSWRYQAVLIPVERYLGHPESFVQHPQTRESLTHRQS